MADIPVIVPYKPRKAFEPYHASTKRFAVTVAHRRCGKTVARVNRLIRAAADCTKLNPRFGYLAPYFVQAKEIAWLYLKHYTAPILAHGGKINESELSVTLPRNNATIRLYGAENAERIRGVYFDGICVDEAQGISKSVLSAIILPSLADRQGWLDCSGTPRGWTNLLGELVKIARSSPDDWFLQILKASETGIIQADELKRQAALMSDNEYQQEFECSFDAAITGAIYGQQIAQADADGRLMPHIEPISGHPVHTAWDLGYDDATAIWWWQIVPGEIRLIDYYQSRGEQIEHYVNIIKSKPYLYGKHYVPHDASAKLLAAGGRSIVQQAYEMGLKMFVVPATSQQNAIEATRKTLERCWFDETACAEGLEHLRQYRFLFNEDKQEFSSKPDHWKHSHAADAFEIIAQIWRTPAEPEKPSKPRYLHEVTAKEVFWPAQEPSRAPERI